MERAERLHECLVVLRSFPGNAVCCCQPAGTAGWLCHGTFPSESFYRLFYPLWNHSSAGLPFKVALCVELLHLS